MTRCFRVVDLRVSIFIFSLNCDQSLASPALRWIMSARPTRAHTLPTALLTLASYLRTASVHDDPPVATGSVPVVLILGLTHPYKVESNHYRELAPGQQPDQQTETIVYSRHHSTIQSCIMGGINGELLMSNSYRVYWLELGPSATSFKVLPTNRLH